MKFYTSDGVQHSSASVSVTNCSEKRVKIQTQLYLRAIQRCNPMYRQGSYPDRQSKTDTQRNKQNRQGPEARE